MTPTAEVWLGTSGYVYRHWRKGVFYPSGLPPRQELQYFASNFKTVELNNPFYRLPTAEMFQRWAENTPSDFQFAVKASRYITHIKRLREVAAELALLLDRADHLGPKLGPMLFQLPPNQQIDIDRLQQFLRIVDTPSGAGYWSFGIQAGTRARYTSCSPSMPLPSASRLAAASTQTESRPHHLPTSGCTEGRSPPVGSPMPSSFHGRGRSAGSGMPERKCTSTSTMTGAASLFGMRSSCESCWASRDSLDAALSSSIQLSTQRVSSAAGLRRRGGSCSAG